VGFMHCH
jgi:hypothetical protein